MFTRTVEVTTKSGKAKELSNTINDKVLPILKKQAGFVDETLLVAQRCRHEARRSYSHRAGQKRRL
jgi:hypothetical protein